MEQHNYKNHGGGQDKGERALYQLGENSLIDTRPLWNKNLQPYIKNIL